MPPFFMTEWRDIPLPHCEGYKVSRDGLIRAYQSERLLKLRTRGKGYLFFAARKICTYDVHVAVAAAFIGPKPEGLIVLHGKGGRLDNRVENLSYGTYRQNNLDRHRDGTQPDVRGERNSASKLTEVQVREILALRGKLPHSKIAAKYQIRTDYVSRIQTGARWGHLHA